MGIVLHRGLCLQFFLLFPVIADSVFELIDPASQRLSNLGELAGSKDEHRHDQDQQQFWKT